MPCRVIKSVRNIYKAMNFKKLGIALAGGGGKGAYQIGVWNALREAGLEPHIAAIAGTSVGGLNGAMMAQGRYDLAEKMWLNVERHNLLTMQGMHGTAEWLAQKFPTVPAIMRLFDSAASKGLFKYEGLQAMIAEGVDASLLASSSVPLTVAWHEEAANRVVYRTLRDSGSVAQGLLATAALPGIFEQVAIDGTLYSDGGFYWGIPGRNLDNIPVRALEDAGCDTVIVICLSRDDLTVAPQHFPGMRVIPIVPRNALGSIMATLDFSNDGAALRMEQGYADAKEILAHLEMYLDTNARYQQLWERIALNAAGAQSVAAQSARIDKTHRATIDDIKDFDRMVAQDRFDQPLEVAPADETLPSSFQRDSEDLLSALDRTQIDTHVERFLAECGRDRNAVENAVLDAIAAVAPVAGRAGTLRDEGHVSRILGALTGRNQKLAADNQLGLAEGQYALMRLVNAVQKQGALSLEFSCVLQNRLQCALQDMARLGQRQNDDLKRVFSSVANVYVKLRDRIVEHDMRLGAVERQGRLLMWLAHKDMPRYHQGRRIAELPQTLRIATIANDFFKLTEGNWHVDELMSARQMSHNAALENAPVHASAFFSDLVEDRVSARILVSGLVTHPTATPPAGAAKWLLALRSGQVEASAEHAMVNWNYGPDAQLPGWELLLEMLYHMRAAGLVPVKHGSDMSAMKEQWSTQLGALEELVAEGLLPKSFLREIAPVRAAIAGFRLKVPLVGKFSAGKSSLINCWLDREIQEIDLGACTSVPAEFHLAAPGHEKLVICWTAQDDCPAPQQDEYPNAYMPMDAIMALAQGRAIAHIERHCAIPALERYPDLVVVDTPGIGSDDIDHDTALAHYLGDGVLFILCANRGQVGTDELAFIQRQKRLGQDFSLLVCQEDLSDPSARERLQRSLAEQAGLAASQLVRGCSALDRNLAGFDDLLAHVERSKTMLFVARHRPLVEALLQRAERLLGQTLDTVSDGELRQRIDRVNGAMNAIDGRFQREETAFLADCNGTVLPAVVADVRTFMRLRRDAYAERLVAQQSLETLVVGDAQNAFELAVRKHFGARLERAGRALEQVADIGDIGNLAFGAGGEQENTTSAGANRTAETVFTAALPIAAVLFPGLGAIGAAIGTVLGKYLLNKSRRVTAENQAQQLIDLACSCVDNQAAAMLEKQALAALAQLRLQIEGRLETERDNLARIDELLREHATKKEGMKQRAGVALEQLRTMVAASARKN